MKNTRLITFKIHKELDEKLQFFLKNNDCTDQSKTIRKAISNYLEQQSGKSTVNNEK